MWSHVSNVAIGVAPILQWKQDRALVKGMVIYQQMIETYHTYLHNQHLETN